MIDTCLKYSGMLLSFKHCLIVLMELSADLGLCCSLSSDTRPIWKLFSETERVTGWYTCWQYPWFWRLTPSIYTQNYWESSCNWTTSDNIFCICQLPEKKWESSGTVHYLFVDIKRANISVMRCMLYNILINSLSQWNCLG